MPAGTKPRWTLVPLLLAAACRATPSPSPPSTAAGFLTAAPAQARPLRPDVGLKPLLTAGDRVGGLVWAPKPDGLGAYADEAGHLVVHASHEIGLADGIRGFPRAVVSRLVLDLPGLAVRGLSYPVGPGAGLQKLCSATWVTAAEGFEAPGRFLIGEELLEGRQLSLAADGRLTELPRMGRFAHENAVAIPSVGGQIALAGLDDARGRSELYLTLADSEADLLAGRSRLHVLASAVATDVGQLRAGQAVQAEFLPIPDEVAAGSGAGLQEWVDARAGAGPLAGAAPIFPFVRLEDADYDRRPGEGPRLFFADTGSEQGGGTSRRCGPGRDQVCDPYGSLYRLDLDPLEPTRRVSLTLLARSSGMAGAWASPDNLAAGERSLMVQEDPAFDGFDRPARILRFPLEGDGLGRPEPLAELAESGCGTLAACWEPSGILDVSQWLGPGHWLLDVQAHANFGPGGRPESGQLLLLTAPGS